MTKELKSISPLSVCLSVCLSVSGTKLAPAVMKPLFNQVYGSGDSSPPQGVELKAPGEPEKPTGPPPRKPPSKDAPIRWMALGLFLGIMVPLILAVIIMIAATGSLDG